MAQGKLIVLNGTSSSGKTSIARALQAQWPTPLLYLALDTAIGMMPFQYTGAEGRAIDGYSLEQCILDGKDVVKYSVGPHGRALNRHLSSFAAALCDDGYDLVLDHVITDDETFLDLLWRTREIRTIVVAVRCKRDVAEARERTRGDRLIGCVAGQFNDVHEGFRRYDLSVDSSYSAPEDLADTIAQFVLGR